MLHKDYNPKCSVEKKIWSWFSGLNMVSIPSPEDGNRSTFRNIVFYNTGRPTKSENPARPVPEIINEFNGKIYTQE
jgi:hypothetical protein